MFCLSAVLRRYLQALIVLLSPIRFFMHPMIPSLKNTFAFVTATDQHLLGYCLCGLFCGLLLLYIRRKFGYIGINLTEINHCFSTFYLFLFFWLHITKVATLGSAYSQLSFDFIYTYDDPYLSLFPTFMIEDTRILQVAKISQICFK